LNQNGQHLIDFAVYNGLKITNTFFKNKNIHKFTWNARGNKPIIDYVLVNQKMSTMVTDTRMYRGADVHSDHFLVISKISLPRRWNQVTRKRRMEETFEVHLLSEDGIRKLYQSILQTYLDDTY
jgi:hypothetical protein